MAQKIPLLKRVLGTRRRKILASILAALAAAGLAAGLLLPDERDERALRLLAGRFRQAELFAEAAAAYGRLIDRYPESSRAALFHLEAAACQECRGRWREADSLYEKYLARFPEHEDASGVRKKLAVLGRVIRYADLVGEKDLPAAKKAEALYDMGLLVRDRMNPYVAAKILAGAADRFPEAPHTPEARHAAGTVLLGLCRLAAARQQFSKLVAAFPESRLAGDAQFWVGHTREMEGRLLGGLDPDAELLKRAADAGSAELRADLDLRRDFAPGAAGLAGTPGAAGLDEDEKRARARELLRSAVAAYGRVVAEHRLSDKAPQALLRVGEINSRYLKDAAAATEAYRQLLEKYPGTPQAVAEQCAVGRTYVKKGKLAEAERIIKLFLVSFPNHPKYGDALLHMAECHRRRKEYVKALDDYQSYLTRYPRSRRAAEVREEIAWLKKYRL